jgi:glycine cleavage system H protein
MVVALVFITIMVCVTIDVIHRRRAGIPRAEVFERYFHPGHCWALVESPQSVARSVTVGIDDLAARVMGKIDRVEIAVKGGTVRQGEPIVTLHSGSKSLSLGSPFSGVVEKVNSGLSAHPSLLRDSPFERGWIAKVAPGDLFAELRGLLKGSAAEQWREEARAQVASWFSPRLGTVLQDGGQWVDDVSRLLSDDEWKELTRVLFFTQLPKQSGS